MKITSCRNIVSNHRFIRVYARSVRTIVILGSLLPTVVPAVGRAQTIFLSGGFQAGVYAYDGTTGAKTGNPLVSSGNFNYSYGLQESGNTLYVVDSKNSGGGVKTFNAITGAPLNSSFITNLNSATGLALNGNLLYVSSLPSSSGTVGMYDAVTGATLNASLVTTAGLVFDVEVSGTTLYLLNGAGQISSYNALTGTPINTDLVNSGTTADFAVFANRLYVSNPNTGAVDVYDATTGAIVTSSFTPYLAARQLEVFGGILYTNNTTISEYNALTGTVIKSSVGTNTSGVDMAVGTVPEPGTLTLALLAFGGAALGWMRYGRSRAR